jgi:2,5-diamino-6-(ribosylamino)-4(3H)-pyrimidinone 5'-phosphate reductase
MSIDGKIALSTGKPMKLSSQEDFKRVHELRNYSDAILVGIETIIKDDPKLTVKSEFIKSPKNPIRIVLDTHGRTPRNANVLDGSAPTFIVVGEKYRNKNFDFSPADVIYCAIAHEDYIDLGKLLKILKEKNIDNLLVEGGSTVIYNFLRNNLVDEMYIFVSPVIIGGITSPSLAGGAGASNIYDVIKLDLLSFKQLGDGFLFNFKP